MVILTEKTDQYPRHNKFIFRNVKNGKFTKIIDEYDDEKAKTENVRSKKYREIKLNLNRQ